MAHYGLFCTQYLLEDSCDREGTCIFRHEPIDAVILDEPIPNGSHFVKAYPLNPIGHNLQINNPDAKSKYYLSRLPCLYNTMLTKCLYKNGNCHYIHPNRLPKEGDLEAMDDCSPSTSSGEIDACSSTSTTTTIAATAHDNDMLGATALINNNTNKQLPFKCVLSSLAPTSSGAAGDNSTIGDNQHLNIDAPEFVPKTQQFNSTVNSKKRLCPFAERDGLCKYPPGECTYLHGDMCDLCTRPALHPFNEELRKKHTQECIKRHERDMEIAFSVARSKDKLCGICFEVIMQKNTQEQRFGILPSCNHCFCLACIRRWRQSKQFENKIIRSCPECRTPSDFVCPSAYWVDTKEDKDKVIDKYKSALAKKDCKYFKHGRGNCPFGNKCFYRHCLNNGKKIDVGPPPSANNSSSETYMEHGVEIIQRLLMLEHRQEGCPLEEFPDDMDLEDIIHMLNLSDFLSDTDDTDYWTD